LGLSWGPWQIIIKRNASQFNARDESFYPLPGSIREYIPTEHIENEDMARQLNVYSTKKRSGL
jgi:hypothetical protein